MYALHHGQRHLRQCLAKAQYAKQALQSFAMAHYVDPCRVLSKMLWLNGVQGDMGVHPPVSAGGALHCTAQRLVWGYF